MASDRNNPWNTKTHPSPHYSWHKPTNTSAIHPQSPRFIDERVACCRPVAVGVHGRAGRGNTSHRGRCWNSVWRLQRPPVRLSRAAVWVSPSGFHRFHPATGIDGGASAALLGARLERWCAGACMWQLAPLALGCGAGSWHWNRDIWQRHAAEALLTEIRHSEPGFSLRAHKPREPITYYTIGIPLRDIPLRDNHLPCFRLDS